MADEKVAAKSGSSMMPILMAMVVTVVLVLGAVGGGVFWLTKSGRLPLAGGPAKVEAASKPDPVKTKLLSLDPLLVNLSDMGGSGYLRIAIVLRVEDPPPPKDAKPKEEKAPEKGKPVVTEDDVMLRDATLDVLGRETSVELLADGGKDKLKEQLKSVLKVRVPSVKVQDVMFTDFLVQR